MNLNIIEEVNSANKASRNKNEVGRRIWFKYLSKSYPPYEFSIKTVQMAIKFML